MPHFRKSPPSHHLPLMVRKHAGSVASHNRKALPASILSMNGRIATVQVEVDCNPALPPLTVPIAESEYVRTPLQPGCKGVLLGADLSLGAMSGLSTRRPTLTETSDNIGNAVFLPLTNAQWEKLDAEMLHLYGVRGVQLTNTLNGNASVTLTDNTITLSTGGASITLEGGTVTITGNLVINGTPYKAHTHSNGNNGAPTGGVLG
ncbi:hypothetical protein [Saccharibacter floricola]|uniref:Phage baseplate assembly protein V n=1 Tax=Saccharibacter floricola DSM 15669 TaxID=1123227 RepID=A0ABQ0NZN5_9PROT|nr:hypothetical protein [Saccharibacter floricola]GBQ07514.1 hypothetical protein AA15669_1413 [Saccharibacter floricola DSM 15669]